MRAVSIVVVGIFLAGCWNHEAGKAAAPVWSTAERDGAIDGCTRSSDPRYGSESIRRGYCTCAIEFASARWTRAQCREEDCALMMAEAKVLEQCWSVAVAGGGAAATDAHTAE